MFVNPVLGSSSGGSPGACTELLQQVLEALNGEMETISHYEPSNVANRRICAYIIMLHDRHITSL